MSRKLGRIKDQLDFPNLIVETEKKEKNPPKLEGAKARVIKVGISVSSTLIPAGFKLLTDE